jgi:hypothetical protein
MVKLCQQYNSHDAYYLFLNNDKFVRHSKVYCMCDLSSNQVTVGKNRLKFASL